MPKDGETVALSTNFLVWAKQAKNQFFCKNFFEMQIFFSRSFNFSSKCDFYLSRFKPLL